MGKDPRIFKIEEVIKPILDSKNLELVDIELVREAAGLVLRLYLDTKEGGIDLDTLSKVSQDISPVLDKADIIQQKYLLEVSSPGIERPLSKPEHFKKYVGSKVFVKTLKSIANRKQFKGLLIDANDKNIKVKIDSEEFEIDYNDIAKARLQVDLPF